MVERGKSGEGDIAGSTALTLRLSPGDLAALDAYIRTQSEPLPSRIGMLERIITDRLVHEGLLPTSRAYVDPNQGDGIRPDQLNATNDD